MSGQETRVTEEIICYSDRAWMVIAKKGVTEYLLIDRKSQSISVVGQIEIKDMKKSAFSAFLGVIDFEGFKFALFCEEARQVSTLEGMEIFEISSMHFASLVEEHELQLRPEKKEIFRKIREYYILLKKGFYFSHQHTLTRSLRKQSETAPSRTFTWNQRLLECLSGCKPHWICPIIQGFVGSFESILENYNVKYLLISRRSTKKGGTRYFDRGIDDHGFVANFVETEQILKLDRYLVSDVQIRGSVPLFFEQVGLTTKIRLSRGYQLTHDVYLKHMEHALAENSHLFFVNLLSVGKGGEAILIEELEKHMKSSEHLQFKYFYYDFHEKVKGGYEKVDEGVEALRSMKLNLRYFVYDETEKKVLCEPAGIFRTNCLDCLDRTNFLQAKLALITLEGILRQFGICSKDWLSEMLRDQNAFIVKFRRVWANNGDNISYHYTGTGSTHSDITRDGKRGWLGGIKHKYKTITRFYNQNFWDFYKMKLVSLLLGSPIKQESLNDQFQLREDQFLQKLDTQVYIFSWKAPKVLPPRLILFPNDVQIIAVNIQEATETIGWRKLVQMAIDTERFVLVSEKISNNNILMVYIRTQLRTRVTLVQTSKVKFKSYFNTLLSTKCAVLIRFSLDSTKLVFVGCQLEYGREFSKNRIKNLREIHEYAFQEEAVGQQKSDSILADDAIFMFGNMNSTVSSAFKNEFTKLTPPSQMDKGRRDLIFKMLETDEFIEIQSSLLEYRQYEEPSIHFPPSYKYVGDAFIPESSGWPDRIWFSTENKIQCKNYSLVEDLRHEHTPVVATFSLQIHHINEEKKAAIYAETIERFTEQKGERKFEEGQGEDSQMKFRF